MDDVSRRRISVTGLGYVGLPVAVAFGQLENVIGFDLNQKRINELRDGIDKTDMITAAELKTTNIYFSSDKNDLANADFHIVAVPTPIDEHKKPELRPLLLASEIIGSVLKKGDIVIYESTVYPGVTEEECIPILEAESNLKSGRDFFLGYSPERINPGDKKHTFKTVKKVVSAQDTKTLAIIAAVYSSVVKAGVYKAPSIKVAEAAKLVENTQRDLNIALMNELAVLFKRMNIDTHDVLEAAGTKWNFLPFEPGLVGGHCIGVDPYYLTYKSISLGYTPQVVLSAREINDSMGRYIAQSLIDNVKKRSKKFEDIIVTILGISYKENVPDIGNTMVINIIKELCNHAVMIQVYDPFVDGIDVKENYQFDLIELEQLEKSDAIILAVAHSDFVAQGWQLMTKLLKAGECVVYDIKSVLNRNAIPENVNLIRL